MESMEARDGEIRMKPYALIVVDMIKDNVIIERDSKFDRQAGSIIPNINKLSAHFRQISSPVIFACDSFLPNDFMFRGRMKPHAIRGTGGDQPIDELNPSSSDHILLKRRMSAFYKTDLDQSLRLWGIETVVVTGIVTNVCVLLTALDAIQNDFRSVIVSDASTSYDDSVHEMTLKIYDKFVLDPLFRIMTTDAIISEITGHLDN